MPLLLASHSVCPVTVQFARDDGTASTVDEDYVSTNGVITFVPGDIKKKVVVWVKGDTKFEPDETFYFVLTNATNAYVVSGSLTNTISNDDPMPTISIQDIMVQESNRTGTQAIFNLQMSAAIGLPPTRLLISCH